MATTLTCSSFRTKMAEALMRKCLSIIGIVLLSLLCYSCGNSSKEDEKTEDNGGKDGITYIPEEYQDVMLTDTARILDSIYAEREHLSSPSTVTENLTSEIGLRLRIYNLELEKTNAALPPNMRTDSKEFFEWLDSFYDITEEYYQKLDSTDPWNQCLVQGDVIEEIKMATEKVREAYKDAVEIDNQ